MDAAQNPSPEALLEHAEYLRSLARRLVRDSATAEDLIQETWLSVLEKPARGVSAIRPWLAGVVRNLARERSRGEGRRARREGLAVPREAVPSPGDLVSRVEGFRELAREVVALEEPYRSTIILRFFHGLRAGEVAARLGIPAATVRSRQKRALEQLRARLDRRHGGDRRAWQALLLPIALGGARRLSLPAATLAWWTLGCATLGAAALLLQPRGSARAAAPSAPSLALAQADSPAAVPAAPPHVAPAGRAPIETGDAGGIEAAAGPAPRRGPVRLALVDRLSSEPIPGFQVEVRDPLGASETVVSGTDGALSTQAAFPERELALYLVDHPALAAFRERPQNRRMLKWTVAHAHRLAGPVPEHPRPVELRIAVGPTYRLRLSTPAGRDPGLLEAALRPTDLGARGEETIAPVRADPEGGLPWARFLSEAAAIGGPPPWPLEVRSLDGFWRGRADVRSKTGRAAEPVEVALAHTGCLELTASGEDGRPLAASLEIRDASGGLVAAAEPAEVHALRWLDPGRHALRARAQGHAEGAIEVEIEAGRRSSARVSLARRPSSGRIAGRVVTASGVYQGEIAVHLLGEDGIPRASTVALVRGSGAATEAAFAFDAVPPGRYSLAATSNWVYRWRAAPAVVSPGVDDARIEGLDAGPTRDAVFRAIDAETGEKIEHFQVLLEVDPSGPQASLRAPRSTYFAAVFFGRIPADARIAWVLGAEGYLPARGDESALAAAGDRPEVLVRLQRGFGRDVRIVDARDGSPLPGARLFVDGREAGSTGADGGLHLRLAAAPRRMDVLFEDWRVVSGLDPAGGTWATVDVATIRVGMSPLEPDHQRR